MQYSTQLFILIIKPSLKNGKGPAIHCLCTSQISNSIIMTLYTIFARSDAVATIYFITQFCVASIREQLLIERAFIKLSVISKIFCKCKGFEKSQFYRFIKELRCGDLVLKQTFQLLDQPPLCYKAVPTRHLQSVSLFSSSNDFTRSSPSESQKMPNFSGQHAFL